MSAEHFAETLCCLQHRATGGRTGADALQTPGPRLRLRLEPQQQVSQLRAQGLKRDLQLQYVPRPRVTRDVALQAGNQFQSL